MNANLPEPKFAYPADCPPELIRRLMEISKDVVVLFAIEARRDGVLLTDGVVQWSVASICAGLTVAAHDTLHRYPKLIADPEVQEWLAKNPQTPE